MKLEKLKEQKKWYYITQENEERTDKTVMIFHHKIRIEETPTRKPIFTQTKRTVSSGDQLKKIKRINTV